MKTLTRMVGVRPMLVLGFVLIPLVAAAAWFNDDWNYRKKLTLDTTPAAGDIDSSPADVPVLVRLHLGNFNYFEDTQSGGEDLRFIAGDDKTPLTHHVESYDPVAQMAFVWVRYPRLVAGTNTDSFFMYYGNMEATDGSDGSGSYDRNQVLVYHFEDPLGVPRDQTAYGNNPAQYGADGEPASLIGAGARFSGRGAINVPAAPSLRLIPDQGLTVTTWLKLEQSQQDAVIAEFSDPSRGSLVLGVNGTTPYVRFQGANGATATVQSPAAGMGVGTWHHVGVAVGDGEVALLLDGAEVASEPVTLMEIGGPVSIGGGVAGSSRLVGAIMDELQISNIRRESAWVKAQFASQAEFSAMVVYGDDGAREGAEASHNSFAVAASHLKGAELFIIYILGVMGLISIIVMILKAVWISRTAGANRNFMNAFRGEDEDGHALPMDGPFPVGLEDREDDFSRSTLWRLYAVGLREVHNRIGGPGARDAKLGGGSIHAITSSLDGAITRETQGMNSGIVILTIAISGGPFLGLLGTVMGVMTTFADIAVAGDVNVNAIAPGTAGALLATVAGLGVAIPALFGYNYLTQRIGNIKADNTVFSDEFVAKVAEHYGD